MQARRLIRGRFLGIVMCGGAAVNCSSRTQKCVTFSATEAEYVALSDVVKEELFMRNVWCFFCLALFMPCIEAFELNHGAVQLAQNPITTSNLKHIDVRRHFLKGLVIKTEAATVIHVKSKLRHATVLIKAIG